MGCGYWICEFIVLMFFWVFLNKTLFKEKDELRYYSFFELWKGTTYLPPGDKPNESQKIEKNQKKFPVLIQFLLNLQ